jgi:hypothetical protein
MSVPVTYHRSHPSAVARVACGHIRAHTESMFVSLGLNRFKGKRVLEVKGLEPRVDSPSWSLMAWVRRKPLGKSLAERELSCWAWYVGFPSTRFDFGAHDFRGGDSTAMQESISANSSDGADGLLHNVALVVTTSNITFYLDAKVQVH